MIRNEILDTERSSLGASSLARKILCRMRKSVSAASMWATWHPKLTVKRKH
jgi:hypothetical protein